MLDANSRTVVRIVFAIIAGILGGIALFTADSNSLAALREVAGGVILIALALVL